MVAKQFEPPIRMTNGLLRLVFRDYDAITNSGSGFQLQASTNLSGPNWVTLPPTFGSTNGRLFYEESFTGHYQQRFYRLKEAP
jgi:hypothetical protein